MQQSGGSKDNDDVFSSESDNSISVATTKTMKNSQNNIHSLMQQQSVPSGGQTGNGSIPRAASTGNGSLVTGSASCQKFRSSSPSFGSDLSLAGPLNSETGGTNTGNGTPVRASATSASITGPSSKTTPVRTMLFDLLFGMLLS